MFLAPVAGLFDALPHERRKLGHFPFAKVSPGGQSGQAANHRGCRQRLADPLPKAGRRMPAHSDRQPDLRQVRNLFVMNDRSIANT